MDLISKSLRATCRRASCAALVVCSLSVEFAVVHLEEVIVTARKRAETLQEVPVSVTAISGDSFEQFGGLVVPLPQYQREDIQEPTIRDAQIPPEEYYPEGYHPELMEEWPTDKPIFIPKDKVPHGMKRRIKEEE